MRTLAGLSLAPEHRRGHGALNHGRIGIKRLRRSLAGLPLPRAADGRLMLAAFEGRSYAGWHRHVTLAVLAQAFCTKLRTDPKAHTPG